MSGRWIRVCHLSLTIWVSIWRTSWIRVRIHPIPTRAINVNIGIITPAVAIVLEDVPAWNIGKEPSFVPILVISVSRILSIEHSIGIPFVEPDVACGGGLHP